MREVERLNNDLIQCNDDMDKLELEYHNLKADYRKLETEIAAMRSTCTKVFEAMCADSELAYFFDSSLFDEMEKIVLEGKNEQTS
jgi:predicted  nucleic acid-binding Zn-ribbon protein